MLSGLEREPHLEYVDLGVLPQNHRVEEST